MIPPKRDRMLFDLILIVFFIAAIASCCSGCASMKHTRKEKEWLGYMVASNVADAGVTIYALENTDATEGNPMFGSEKPDEVVIIGLKILATLIGYAAGVIWPEDRLQIYKVITYVNGGVAGWNAGQIITADR